MLLQLELGQITDYPITDYRDNLTIRVNIRINANTFDPVYLFHNRKVCEMVYHVTHGTNAWSVTGPYVKRGDGQGAMAILNQTYLGTSHINLVKTTADSTIEKVFWNGTARGFTFDQFIAKLTQAFADLAEHGEAKGKEEKVCKLLQKIKDPKLRIAKATIYSNPIYYQSYDTAVDFLCRQLATLQSDEGQHRRLAEMARTTGGRNSKGGRSNSKGRGGRGGRQGRGGRNSGTSSPGGRFSASGHFMNNGGYPRKVWDSFTGPEKTYILSLRGENREPSNKRTIDQLETSQQTPTQRPKTEDGGNGGSSSSNTSQMFRPGSNNRNVSILTSLSRALFPVKAHGTTRCELDSHADTCAFGNGVHILRVHSKNVSVSGFLDDVSPSLSKVSIVDLAVAYDCLITHTTYVLVFNQVLWIPKMSHHLINPDQLRENSVVVNDIPLLWIDPSQRSPSDHCIIEPSSKLRIPLSYTRPISYFNVRKSTQSEATDALNHNHVVMTSSIEWIPYLSALHADEELLRSNIERRHDYQFELLHSFQNTTDVIPIQSFHIDVSALSLALGDSLSLCQVSSSGRSSLVTPEQLASRWRCSTEVAKRTLLSTTQRAVHDYSNIVGGRRLRPTQYQLRYPRLNRQLYCDTWYGPCTSLEGNNFAVVYSASCQWSRVFPVKQRKDAHVTLDHLFRSVGFPEAIVPDYAAELTKGQFLKKAQQAQVHIHPIEPYMHNLRPAEDCIRELVRLYSCAMVAMNVPAVLWDRCMMWVSEIRSHMHLGHLEQNGQVGTTCMTGNTADVSHIVNFTFYEWIWYHTPGDTGVKTRMQLGKWCGPSFDVGDALCYAVINSKGSILHKTSVFPLKDEELRSEHIKAMKSEWETELKAKLGRRIKGLIDLDTDPARGQISSTKVGTRDPRIPKV